MIENLNEFLQNYVNNSGNENENDDNDVSSADALRDFGAFFNLPDAEFQAIAPLILENVEQGMNDNSFSMAMLSAIDSNHLTTQEILASVFEFEGIVKELKLSQCKQDFLMQMYYLMSNRLINVTQEKENQAVIVPIVLDNKDVQIPSYQSAEAAGMDIYAIEDTVIKPGETKLIPTGIHMKIPAGYAMLIHPRSGLSLKSNLRIANSIGLIDSDYTGEIKIIMENTNPPIKDIQFDEEGHGVGILHGESYTITKGQRFAQMRLVAVPKVEFKAVSSLESTERNEGGFGSTDAKN